LNPLVFDIAWIDNDMDIVLDLWYYLGQKRVRGSLNFADVTYS